MSGIAPHGKRFNCLPEIASIKSRLPMIQKNASLLIIIAGTMVVIFSEGKHRGLLLAGVWLLAVGFGLMFNRSFS